MSDPTPGASCDGGGDNNKVCVPCSSLDPSHLMSQQEIESRIATTLPLWTLEVSKKEGDEENSQRYNFLSRRFVAKDFQCALDAINAIGQIAERENHHPNIHLTNYRYVEIVVYTHKLNGITENDLVLAHMFDTEVQITYSPKWLREHPEAAAI